MWFNSYQLRVRTDPHEILTYKTTSGNPTPGHTAPTPTPGHTAPTAPTAGNTATATYLLYNYRLSWEGCEAPLYLTDLYIL